MNAFNGLPKLKLPFAIIREAVCSPELRVAWDVETRLQTVPNEPLFVKNLTKYPVGIILLSDKQLLIEWNPMKK